MLSQRPGDLADQPVRRAGLVLFMATALVACSPARTHLWWSAGVTLALKVFLLPWILHRLIRRLNVKWDVETLVNIPTIMLGGIVLVMAFNRRRRSRSSRARDARDAGHRARLGAAVVPDDDHALQGGAAGGRSSWRWKMACSSPRTPRSTACRWWSSSASPRRAGGGADPRRVPVPDPQPLRLGGRATSSG